MRPTPNRFSLAILMGFIGVLAVGLGLMRNGSTLASRITLAVVPIALLVGLLGALVRRREPGWVGFALFGWSYALLAFAAPLESNYNPRLNPAADLVDDLVGRLHPGAGAMPAAPTFNPQFERMIGDKSNLRHVGLGPGMSRHLFSVLSPEEADTLAIYQDQLATYEGMSQLQSERKGNAEDIGHATLALIFALVGSVLGRALAHPATARPPRQDD